MQLRRFQKTLTDEYPCRQISDGVATLLLPPAIQAYIQDQLRIQGCTLGIFLKKLIQKYRPYLLEIPENSARSKCQRLYQAAGLGLKKRNFRPEIKSWSELGVFANFLGVSRCYLFVMLVQLDMSGLEPEEGLPTDRIIRYDANFPDRLEFREILEMRAGKAIREISLKPVAPWRLRYDLWPYPPPIDWLQKRVREGG